MQVNKYKLVGLFGALIVLAIIVLRSPRDQQQSPAVPSATNSDSPVATVSTAPANVAVNSLTDCDPLEVYTSDLKKASTKGAWLEYMPPSYNTKLHIGLYDMTDYGAKGPSGYKRYFDTAWQLRCVAGSSGQASVFCPLETEVSYQKEILPKLVDPETADQNANPPGCSKYTDDAAMYFCNTVETEAEIDLLQCAGTWRLWVDGKLIEEYVDRAGTKPPQNARFRKIIINPDDSSPHYRVRIAFTWQTL